MKTWLKVLIITVVCAAITMPLGQILWTSPSGSNAPVGGEIALFVILALYEGIAFGLGASFILFGLPLLRRATLGSTGLTGATFASIAWLLLSWWPHDGFHRSVTTLQGLLLIEYGFHVTLISAGVIIAFAFYRLLRRAATAGVVATRTMQPRQAEQTA